jgi:hypothetical protein
MVVKDGIAPPGGFTLNKEAEKLAIEEGDLSGLPLPIPAIVTIIVIGGLLVILLPRFFNKKKESDSSTSA